MKRKQTVRFITLPIRVRVTDLKDKQLFEITKEELEETIKAAKKRHGIL